MGTHTIGTNKKNQGKLTPTQQSVWEVLQTIYMHYEIEGFLNDDKSITVDNATLANWNNCSIWSASNAIRTLTKLKYIKVKYQWVQKGTERRIWILK